MGIGRDGGLTVVMGEGGRGRNHVSTRGGFSGQGRLRQSVRLAV